jgi:threonylcarbamoyladenosine tRNA methylthiotransferase MtaB
VRRAFLARAVGTVAEVLMERGGIGHTAHYAPLRPDRPVPVGAVFRARVTGVAGDELMGEVE